jgi:hypothetical protein
MELSKQFVQNSERRQRRQEEHYIAPCHRVESYCGYSNKQWGTETDPRVERHAETTNESHTLRHKFEVF